MFPIVLLRYVDKLPTTYPRLLIAVLWDEKEMMDIVLLISTVSIFYHIEIKRSIIPMEMFYIQIKLRSVVHVYLKK